MEMLESIRDAANDDRTIYLMWDWCWIHYGIDDVDIKMKELNIVPIMNVSYRFEFNPCERLFAGQDAQRSRTKRLAYERGDVRSILHVKPILPKDDS